MNITFNKYMDNPSMGTSAFSMRTMYRQLYRQKYDQLLTREQGKIMFRIYNAEDGHDSHYFHFKIPSESVAGLYYDVVIKLWTNNNSLKESANFRDHFVQFFANDSAFVFTFAHAFKKNGLFLNDLEKKMNSMALKDKAVIRNPKDDIWYVKSLCFAYFTMERYNLFSRSVANQLGTKLSVSQLMKDIKTIEEKTAERAMLEKEQKSKSAKERLQRASERQLANRNFSSSTADKPRSITYTKNIKTKSTIKTVKRSNTIRSVKKH